MIHLAWWPFKKIDSWLRSYYEKKQTQELIAIEQQRLLSETVPDLDVSVRVVPEPEPPNPNTPSVYVVLCNYGGKTKLLEGTFWIGRSDDPYYSQKKYLVEVEMPKGKEEKFFLPIMLLPYWQIMAGHSVLKFSYDLIFEGATKQKEVKSKTYHYNPPKDSFISE